MSLLNLYGGGAHILTMHKTHNERVGQARVTPEAAQRHWTVSEQLPVQRKSVVLGE